jgi:hypothetical protein
VGSKMNRICSHWGERKTPQSKVNTTKMQAVAASKEDSITLELRYQRMSILERIFTYHIITYITFQI